jgi:hypothetical protein
LRGRSRGAARFICEARPDALLCLSGVATMSAGRVVSIAI